MRLRTALATCALGLAPLLVTNVARAQQPGAAPAAGQDGHAAVRMALRIAHNQLGVLQYCQANGSVGAEVVDLQRRLLARMAAALPPVQGGRAGPGRSGRQARRGAVRRPGHDARRCREAAQHDARRRLQADRDPDPGPGRPDAEIGAAGRDRPGPRGSRPRSKRQRSPTRHHRTTPQQPRRAGRPHASAGG